MIAPGTLDPRLQRPVPRYTSYPPVPAWQGDVDAAAYQQRLVDLAHAGRRPVSVYVHLPFCRVRCLYCGCNVTITSRPERLSRYVDMVLAERALVNAQLGGGWPVAQLHLGGGTPNYLAEADLVRLMEGLSDGFAFDEASELSIEADPRLVTPGQLALLANLGFTRISFGVQDLDPDVQGAIGRVQSAELVASAIDAAREAGFTGINVDLIYGLPRQDTERFDRTLSAVIAMRVDRIACFGYAHVPWLQKHQLAIVPLDLPDPATRLTLFREAVYRLEDAGYVWIGLDHFALPEDPLARALEQRTLTRDFMGYTTRPTSTLLALGASAIGDIDGVLVQNHARLDAWEADIVAGRLAVARGHRMTEDDHRRRAAIMALMCNLRLPLTLANGALADSMERLQAWAAEGLVAEEDGHLVVTRWGRYFLRSLCAEFDAYLPSEPVTRFSQAV